jgi:hypothetical protein
MLKMKKCLSFILFSLILSLPPLTLYGMNGKGYQSGGPKEAAGKQTIVYPVMPEPGKKVPFGDGYTLVYGFDKKPKMGMVILKAEIFTREGKKDTSFEIKADAGMPSMRGAHDTGEKPFKLSNKGDYLLPINIMMPGDWDIRLTITKDGKVIFRGRHNFNV